VCCGFNPPLCPEAHVFRLVISLLSVFGWVFSLVFNVVRYCSATGLLLVCLRRFMRCIARARNRIAVMYLGKIVEMGQAAATLSEPLHPYTKALVSNVPIPDPDIVRERIHLKGEIPTPINPPSGCRLHPRCPYVIEKCSTEEPKLIEVEKGHFVACHLVE